MLQYQLIQSSTLNRYSLALYGLLIVTIGTFLHELDFVPVLLLVLSVLLLVKDQSRYRLLKSQDPTIVILTNTKSRIELKEEGNLYQFDRLRLFSTRWFLILQLKNASESKNIMLVPDRFRTINEYLQFRYQMINMNRVQHVT